MKANSGSKARTILATSFLMVASGVTISSAIDSDVCGLDPISCAKVIGDFADYFQLEYITLDMTESVRPQPFIIMRRELKRYVSLQPSGFVAKKSLDVATTPAVKGKRFPNLHVRFKLKEEPEHLMNQIALPTHKSDFWLLEAARIDTPLEDLLSNFTLDLTSNVYLFVPENSSIVIYEVYKIRTEDIRVIVQKLASWSIDAGMSLASNQSFWERRSDLRGTELKIAALPTQPYLEMDKDKDLVMSGMYPDVFHVLQGLLNFTYIFSQPQDGSWGIRHENGSWSGMIGQLQRGEIDIAPAPFTITNLRSKVVDFALPIVEMHHRFFVKNPKDGFNWRAYTDPLGVWVWIMMGFILIVAPVVLWLAIRRFDDPQKKEFKVYRSFLFVAGAMPLARPWSVVPETPLGKFVFINIMLTGTFIFWHWEAMLISFLAVKTKSLPFHNIEELMGATDFK